MTVDAQAAREADLGKRLRLVALINVTFVLLCLIWWREVVRLVAEPLQWATWMHVGPHSGIFEYPMVLVWSLPLGGTLLAWCIRQSGHLRAALSAASFPLTYIILVIVCFYVVPRFVI